MSDINSLPLKNYLSKEWKFFKDKIDFFIINNQQNITFTHDKFEFNIRESLSEENILIFRNEKNNNSLTLSVEISKFSRIIEFEKGANKNYETIFDSYDIKRFIDKYQLVYPLYYDIISKKEKSVSYNNLRSIIKKKEIKKIYQSDFYK